MNITAKTKLCVVIGGPIEHSLSPVMHNAGYQELGIDSEYVYVALRVVPGDLADFIKGVRAMGIRGVSCTIPHKRAVMPYLDEIDAVATKIGAVNTIMQTNGSLKGYNSDWLGAITPLEKQVVLKGKKVALLGAGGAARAIAYGVTAEGADLSIYNRTLAKAQELADDFGGQARPLQALQEVKEADIIINATSVGLQPGEDETPLPKEFITSRHLIFDAVYTPYETRLLREAKQRGATVIHGSEMLLYQGAFQFELFTGHKAPVEQMRGVLLEALGVGR